MFKKLLLLSIVFLATINVSKTFACQTDGCDGYVYGPVVAAYVAGDDTMYIGAAIKDTTALDNGVKSGADDDACHQPDDYVLGAHWAMVSPFGIDSHGRATGSARANSQAMLDMLRESQKGGITPQIMVIFYTWSSALTSCVITGVGYYNG